MENWAYTIKYNKNDLTADEYKQKINQLIEHWKLNKVDVKHIVYETEDKRGQPTKLHAHGLIQIKRGLYRKKLQLDGYHVKLVSIYNSEGWKDYCNKNLKLKIDPEQHDYYPKIVIPRTSLFIKRTETPRNI